MKKYDNINDALEQEWPEWNMKDSPVLPSGSQYDPFPQKKAGYTVLARYVADDDYDDNILIKALPPRRSSRQIVMDSVNGIPYTTWEEEINKPFDKQYNGIRKLFDWRIALPCQDELEQKVNMLFHASYRRRIPFFDKNATIRATINNKDENTHGRFIKDGKDTGYSGLFVLGLAGSGKTNSVDKCLRHYPPNLLHEAKDGHPYRQIPYLFVNCPPNSNFKTLYAYIGNDLDVRLGNVQPTYKRMFEEAGRDLGKCQNILISLIEIFGIGIIVIDEVQNINVTSSKYDNSMDSLEFISNHTDVGFIWIGTEFSLNRINSLKTLRRAAGNEVRVDRYCKDYKSFKGIMLQLLKYQWFDERITAEDDDVIQAFYKFTGGIINQLVMLYTTMNLMALKNRVDQARLPEEKRTKMIITPEIVEKVTLTYFSHIYAAIVNTKYDEQEIALMAKSSEVFNAIERDVKEKIAGGIAVESINDMLLGGVIQENVHPCGAFEEVKYGNENEVYYICSNMYGDKYNSESLKKMIEKAYKQLNRRHVQLLTPFVCEEVRKIERKMTKNDRRPGSKQEVPDNATLEISDLRENFIENQAKANREYGEQQN